MQEFPPDSILIKGLQNGSYKDFDLLYEKYVGSVYAFVYSLSKSHELSEDVVQDAFIRVWEKRELLSSEFSFKSFLFTIARNRFLNILRTDLQKNSYDDYVQSHATGEAHNEVEENIFYKDLCERITEAKTQLTERQCEILELSRELGLSHKDIAERLSISEQSVRNQLSAALKRLRASLDIGAEIVFWIVFLSRNIF